MNTAGRVRGAIVVAVAGLVLGTVVPPAAAARTVGPSDFPSVKKLTKAYPYYADGSRDLLRVRRISIRTEDCVAWTNGPRARSGALAVYYDRDNQSPYFAGKADARTGLFIFRSDAAAARAFDAVQDSITACEGVNRDGRLKVSSREVPIPDLGQQRIAYRERKDGFGADPQDADFSLDIWVRDGRRLVNTTAQRDPGAPAKDPLTTFARTAVRAVGG